jgi:hypothetical protein
MPAGRWPENVKGLARYVLSRSPNISNYPALEAWTINPPGANDPTLMIYDKNIEIEQIRISFRQ